MKSQVTDTASVQTGEKVTLTQAATMVGRLKDNAGEIMIARISSDWYLLASDGDISKPLKANEKLLFCKLSTPIEMEADMDICVSIKTKLFCSNLKDNDSACTYLLNLEERQLQVSSSKELKAPRELASEGFEASLTVRNAGSRVKIKKSCGITVKILSSSKPNEAVVSVNDSTALVVQRMDTKWQLVQLDKTLCTSLHDYLSKLPKNKGTLYLGHDRYYLSDNNFHNPNSLPTRIIPDKPIQHMKYDKASASLVGYKPLFDREFSISSDSLNAFKKFMNTDNIVYYNFFNNVLLLYSAGFYLVIPIGRYAKYVVDPVKNTPTLSRDAAFSRGNYKDIVKYLKSAAKNGSQEVKLSFKDETFVFHTKNADVWKEAETMPFRFKDNGGRLFGEDFTVYVTMDDLEVIAKRHPEDNVRFRIEQFADAEGNKTCGLKLVKFRDKKGMVIDITFEIWHNTAVEIVDERAEQADIADIEEFLLNTAIDDEFIIDNPRTREVIV